MHAHASAKDWPSYTVALSSGKTITVKAPSPQRARQRVEHDRRQGLEGDDHRRQLIHTSHSRTPVTPAGVHSCPGSGRSSGVAIT
jgi:hypothetical protein